MFDVMQGDSYSIAFGIYDSNGIAINPTGVEDVEITMGEVTKRYSDESLSFAYGKWIFPLTEEETRDFGKEYVEDISVKLKIKTKSGEIVGRRVGEISLIFDD